jgi:CheY-like chemotaxis protein
MIPSIPVAREARRVLIVEDVDALRMLVRFSLEKVGADVKEAATLQAARAALREGYRPDLVLLDLELGDGHGLDLVREVPPSASVHVLTADVTKETRLRCEQAGCAGVIPKEQDLSVVAARLLQSDHKPVSAGRVEPDVQMGSRYIEFLAETRVKLATALENGELEVLRAVAHRLRGTAVHFGYPGLSATSLALSKALRTQNDGEMSVAVDQLNTQIGDALESFQCRQRLRSV